MKCRLLLLNLLLGIFHTSWAQTSFDPVCSGNQYEIQSKTLSVATAGSYTLVVSYRSPERHVTGIVRINGQSQTQTFAQTNTYQNLVISPVTLNAGSNTIELSSGPFGGYLCFNGLSASAGSSNPNPDPSCAFTPTVGGSAAISCNGSLHLSAGCGLIDCSGITYTWTGPGVNHTGSVLNSTGPGENGTYSYTVTLSRPGCPSKSKEVAVTVSGCGSNPNPEGNSCSTFAETCSGNQFEVRTQTLNVATAGNYLLAIGYRSPERAVIGMVRVNGQARLVNFSQTSSYQTLITSGFDLKAGSNTIELSSGADGGYVCFNSICTSGGTPTPGPNCDYGIGAGGPVGVACNSSITLNAFCGRPDCSGVVYTWSGPGITQSEGSPIRVIAPGELGSYQYTATATRPGCPSRSFQYSVIVDRCGGEDNPRPFNQCVEAEDAAGSGTVYADGSASGGKGRGDYGNSSEFLDYTISGVPVAGQYLMKLRYASGETPSAGILVNGVGLQTINLGRTNGAYVERTLLVNLQLGNNTIRVQGGPGGAFRMDKICVSADWAARLAAVSSEAVVTGLNLRVSPNPSPGPVKVQFYAQKGEEVQLTVSNITGVNQVNRRLVAEGGDQTITLSLPASAGPWAIVRAQTSRQSETKKIWISR